MLTVEIENPSGIDEGKFQVVIVLDEEGFTELKRQLNFLEGAPDHVHLATPAWAGTELDDEGHDERNLLVNQVTIYKVVK